jgi:hypothetical protein
METSEINSLLEISLYLKGPDLDVDEVSRLLGVSPSRVNRRGEPKVRGKSTPVYSTTTWKFSRKAQSRDVSGTLVALLRDIDATARPDAIAGVESAFLDVFLANTVEVGNLGASIEWDWSIEALQALNRIALPVRVSVCNVEP